MHTSILLAWTSLQCLNRFLPNDAFEFMLFEFNLVFWVFLFWEIMVRPWPYWPHRFLRPCHGICHSWPGLSKVNSAIFVSAIVLISILSSSTTMDYILTGKWWLSFTPGLVKVHSGQWSQILMNLTLYQVDNVLFVSQSWLQCLATFQSVCKLQW